MTAIFVTATGTEIGKTFVAAGIIAALREQGRAVEALKPVVTGFTLDAAAASDPGVLLTALGRPVNKDTIAEIAPWRFAAPLSPDMAARREGGALEFQALVTFCRERMAARQDVLLIEGVGGVMVPLDDTHTVLDWMVALSVPVILVTGSYLGTLSHTLTAFDVLRRNEIEVRAIVVNESSDSTVPLDETMKSIAKFTDTVDVLTLPRSSGHRVFGELAARMSKTKTWGRP
jgi:dethiobiotin synthetase